jgi:hypothetical protein
MQTLLATQQKTAHIFTPAPSADNKRTATQVEDANSSKERKVRRHRLNCCEDCGQVDHTLSSDACPHPGINARKVQKRRKDEVATDIDAKKEARSVYCYALLRMRPLLNSWAECSVVISCGKVDYDKSG